MLDYAEPSPTVAWLLSAVRDFALLSTGCVLVALGLRRARRASFSARSTLHAIAGACLIVGLAWLASAALQPLQEAAAIAPQAESPQLIEAISAVANWRLACIIAGVLSAILGFVTPVQGAPAA